MLSGIGDSDILSAAGVQVIVDLPDVGKNMQASHYHTFTLCSPMTLLVDRTILLLLLHGPSAPMTPSTSTTATQPSRMRRSTNGWQTVLEWTSSLPETSGHS